jgi:hypothetical protein
MSIAAAVSDRKLGRAIGSCLFHAVDRIFF